MNLEYEVLHELSLTVQWHYEDAKMVYVTLIPFYPFTQATFEILSSQMANTFLAAAC